MGCQVLLYTCQMRAPKLGRLSTKSRKMPETNLAHAVRIHTADFSLSNHLEMPERTSEHARGSVARAVGPCMRHEVRIFTSTSQFRYWGQPWPVYSTLRQRIWADRCDVFKRTHSRMSLLWRKAWLAKHFFTARHSTPHLCHLARHSITLKYRYPC